MILPKPPAPPAWLSNLCALNGFRVWATSAGCGARWEDGKEQDGWWIDVISYDEYWSTPAANKNFHRLHEFFPLHMSQDAIYRRAMEFFYGK